MPDCLIPPNGIGAPVSLIVLIATIPYFHPKRDDVLNVSKSLHSVALRPRGAQRPHLALGVWETPCLTLHRAKASFIMKSMGKVRPWSCCMASAEIMPVGFGRSPPSPSIT